MSTAAKRALSVLLFLLLLAVLLGFLNRVFIRKSLTPPWDMTNKISGFYNEPPEEFPVMFFGSSHAYASISPLELWHETGIKSYVFATQQQPMWATAAYIRDALKTQSPSVIVVEVQMMTEQAEYSEAGVVHSYLDDMPLSCNKLRLIGQSAAGTDRLPYLLPLLRYHDRWKELTEADFTLRRSALLDPYKGYVLLPGTGFVPGRFPPAGSGGIAGKSWQALMEVWDICRSRGIDLWLIKAPSNPDGVQAAQFLSLAGMLSAQGLALEDFNGQYDALGLDLAADFYDQHHLNAAGAIKFTDAFAALLAERYPGLEKSPDDPQWAADYEQYKKDAAAAMG